MTYKVDNIDLDPDNTEFNSAAEFVKHTDKLVYLTGKAGTGKTTFLKYIKETTDKNTVILAPTGVAAINAGGVTIHSFFHIPFGPFLPYDQRLSTSGKDVNIYNTFTYNREKRDIIKNLELLIIDEVSMVRCDLLDVIDKILRVFRKKSHLRFGGVQVILIGDTFQLPPIANSDQWAILSEFYKTEFFFSAKVIEQHAPLYIELKKIYRQNEQEFINLLNKVRVNDLSQRDFQVLNGRFNPAFSGNGADFITLATHNRIVNDTNLTKLNQLETQQYTYEADVTGNFQNSAMPTDEFLRLKEGAQVMFVKNDSAVEKRYFNGKIGKVKELEEGEILVEFDDGSKVQVERAEWKNLRYTYNKEKKKIEEEVIGSFVQFPLRLAWAITVHKSQGLTFEKVIADLAGAFTAGQVYVALSRCTSINGLVLKTKLHPQAVITHPEVIRFARNETPNTLITEQLTSGKADFYYKRAREDFEKGNMEEALEHFERALKFRNDLGTEEIRRYVSVHGARLYRMKDKLKLAAQKEEEAESNLAEANETVEILKSELRQSQNKIESQNNSIKLLLEKVEALQDALDMAEEQNLDFEAKLVTANDNLRRLEASNSILKSKLKEQTRTNQSQQKELERWKNLKWYQRLFGQGK